MKGQVVIKMMWMLAVMLLLGHDFIPHRHVHKSEKHHSHDHDQHPANEDQGLDVIGFFYHTHGVGQQDTVWFSSDNKSIKHEVETSYAVFLRQADFSYYIARDSQPDWPRESQSNPPPLLPGSNQLRAPPITSSILS